VSQRVSCARVREAIVYVVVVGGVVVSGAWTERAVPGSICAGALKYRRMARKSQTIESNLWPQIARTAGVRANTNCV
jgi:hypothetical protein